MSLNKTSTKCKKERQKHTSKWKLYFRYSKGSVNFRILKTVFKINFNITIKQVS